MTHQRLLALLLLLSPQWAWAHLVSTRFGEFYAGMVHPLTALNHLLPWIALALLAGLQPAPAGRRNMVAFPLAVALGTVAGCLLPASALIDQLNLLAFCGLGLLVALALRLQPTLFVLIGILFGLAEGYSNGTSDVYGTGFWLYVAGVAAMAYLVVTLVSAGACWINQRVQWGSIAVRALGSWIMAVGILYSGFMLFKPAAV